MTLNHSRILSSECYVAASNKNSANATVNLHIEPSQDELKVLYPDTVESPYSAIPETEKVLRLILEAYVNNPLFVNKLVVMQTPKLLELIKTMTNADEVELETATDISCCGARTQYNHIGSIVIIKSGSRTDFKVAYNDSYRMLKDYKISLKLTVD